MDTDQRALLNTILANPDDDAPRLIYADWLDENEQAEHAEFIRLQIELSLMNPKECNQGTCNQAGYGPCSFCRQRDELENKIDLIWNTLNKTGPAISDFSAMRYVKKESDIEVPYPLSIVRRGFIDEIRCRAKDWEQHGDAILADHPVRTVKLTANPRPKLVKTIDGDEFYEINGKAFVTIEESHAEWASCWPTVKFEFAPVIEVGEPGYMPRWRESVRM